MPSSSVKINYILRPAKSIERKMLVEAFQRLEPFGAVSAYRYIGFGSFYFSDFMLFHKRLGVTNMLSIERDVDNLERFNFNKPFNCIGIRFGESNDILPQLDWDIKSIIWLDYDNKLNQNVLTDISFICTNIIPGSMFLVSVNVHPEFPENQPDDPRELNEYRYNKLVERVGELNVPIDIAGKDLAGWNLSDICKQIIRNKIDEAISNRNGPKLEENKINFKQLFHILYQDGARMLTFGGIFIDNSQDAIFSSCDFLRLPFVCPADDKPYIIEVPNLTFKEIRHLNSQLPLKDGETLIGDAIPDIDLTRYKEIYRYFPAFAETEI